MNKTTLLSCNQILDIFSASHIATAIYTTENLIIEAATDAMLAFWGKDRSIIGQPLAEAVPELEGQPFIALLQNVLTTGITNSGEGAAAETQIDGRLQTRYYDYEYWALRNEAGQVYCLLHTASDVTERVLGQEAIKVQKEQQMALEREQALNEELAAANEELSAINEELQQTQHQLQELNEELEQRVIQRTQALTENEANMRYLIDSAPVAISIHRGRAMVIESANQEMLKLWDKTGDVNGKTFSEVLPELNEQGFLQVLDQVYASGEPFYGNEAKALIRRDGKMREGYYNFVFQPVKNADGQTHSLLMVGYEVTEQVLARKAAEAGKYRLEAMVANTPVAMTVLKGRDLVIELANQPMLNVWRRNHKQVIGRPLTDVFPELKDQPNPGRMRNVFYTGQPFSLPETPVMLADADGQLHTHYAKFSYDPIFDREGNVESLLVTVMDITEMVNSRRLIEESRAHLQELTEELAATNEELSATNEEMTASNEELVSTNEELLCIHEQLNNTVDQLKDSEQRFRFLLDAMPQQVWTATPDGALNYANQIACNDFGYNSEEIVGHGWKKFIHPNDLQGAVMKWIAALETGGEYLVEFRLLFNDDEYRWHLARAVPLIENGVITLWIGTNTDIDLQKRNEQKKDEFLSIASHELKTPLTSIKAFNQIMSRINDAEKLNGFVGKSAAHIHRLERLIADLLDVTKINAGKMEYNMQEFSFKQLLQDSVESVQHMSASHEIILENAVDFPFTGDHLRLEQVMNNFLTNAVKYSPKGEKVVVNSKLEEGHVIVSVQDFGIGIPPTHLEKLFDRYYRVDNTAMRFEGLGLGLFISSEILKRHQGKFWIESEVGKGSTFYFSIPVVQEKEMNTDELTLDLGEGIVSAQE